ncbi:hypothetical protein [Amycolatopsis sp. lyj-112]|uniref:hypothetical protein n=1 Tax=Amycolatopsis sp. lyj-112 TaxID=2789288 RepID=UPI00397B3DF8
MTTLSDPPRNAVARILDMIGSLVHYRALFDHAPIGDLEVERAVEALMRGIATDYPVLLAHSRRLSAAPAVRPHD